MENIKEYIRKLSVAFSKQHLYEAEVNTDPMKQFELWFVEAVESKAPAPNAMTVSTTNAAGHPSGRILLLRDFNEKGFVFYTNYNSQKARELNESPYASLTFFWPSLERQVRIDGPVVKQTAEESDSYFKTRPDGSKLGAWASPQSEIVSSRDFLDARYEEMESRFRGSNIPRPEHWGGYCLKPEFYEFWQGRPNRFHDRIAYYPQADGHWQIKRLAP
ncbi:MAG: pyridoxamine 5'-phosphate oxidase [Bacteroidetes bacterium]|nr:pyridoxamine 5'-phosphate oxidase [Bacteroidota bacterium]